MDYSLSDRYIPSRSGLEDDAVPPSAERTCMKIVRSASMYLWKETYIGTHHGYGLGIEGPGGVGSVFQMLLSNLVTI